MRWPSARSLLGADRVTVAMVATAVAVALAEFIGRKGDTTPDEGCGRGAGCTGYVIGAPILVMSGGMLLVGIILRMLDVEGRHRIVRILFPMGLLCVVGLHNIRYVLDRSVGAPETLFPSTFEWMAADDLVLAAVAALAALVTEPHRSGLQWRSVVRATTGLVVMAGLWSALILSHGDALRG